jgi:nucleotide-binding universal stress UspA family protein
MTMDGLEQTRRKQGRFWNDTRRRLHAMKKIRRVLHPTDFSPPGRAALARAIEMARAQKAELVIAHVLPVVMPMMVDGYMSPKVYEDIQRSARQHAQKQLDAVIARARKAGARARTVLLEGVPATQITRAAKSQHADVIIMGTHGRTGFARVLLGSVAERVVGTAPCPVLTVRSR